MERLGARYPDALVTEHEVGPLDELGMRPLNARSLVLSLLLGQVQPAMSSGALARLGPVFGIQGGTMRTALSRMVAAGELVADDGEYRLAGRLLERKAAQDIGRRPAPVRVGRHVVDGDRHGRPTGCRRAAQLPHGDGQSAHGRAAARHLAATGQPGRADRRRRVGRRSGAADGARRRARWSTCCGRSTSWRRRPVGWRRCSTGCSRQLETGAPSSLAVSIGPSAAVVRFLRAEPLLPAELVPASWPPDELRARYRDFDAAFGRTLQAAVRAAT